MIHSFCSGWGHVLPCAAMLAVIIDARALAAGDVASALWMHGLAALMAAAAFPGRGAAGSDCPHRYRAVAFTLAAMFPVLGTAAVAALALAVKWRRVDPARLARLLEDAAPPLARPAVRENDADRTWRAMDLAPFSSILASHQDGEVLASAFASVMLLDRPVACRLLRQALSSEVPMTRYYASTALASIEEELDRELEAALDAAERAPADLDLAKRLAEARLAYADVASAEDPVARFHVAESVRLHEWLLERVAEDERPAVMRKLARGYMLLGQPAAAQRQLVALLDAGCHEAPLWREAAEAAHLAGDGEALKRCLERLQPASVAA
jgi:hypothetical protein